MVRQPVLNLRITNIRDYACHTGRPSTSVIKDVAVDPSAQTESYNLDANTRY